MLPIIGLIPSSRTLSCRIDLGSAADFTDSMAENYPVPRDSIKVDPTEFCASLAFRRHAAFELGAQILAVLLLARCQLGLGLAEEFGELVDVERFEVDGCHFGLHLRSSSVRGEILRQG